jgi:hypothetical protein
MPRATFPQRPALAAQVRRSHRRCRLRGIAAGSHGRRASQSARDPAGQCTAPDDRTLKQLRPMCGRSAHPVEKHDLGIFVTPPKRAYLSTCGDNDLQSFGAVRQCGGRFDRRLSNMSVAGHMTYQVSTISPRLHPYATETTLSNRVGDVERCLTSSVTTAERVSGSSFVWCTFPLHVRGCDGPSTRRAR